MREGALKAGFLGHLLATRALAPDCLLASEFAVDDHNRRADIAVFGDEFVGYEIKTEFDTLRRLAPQVETFRRYFDIVEIIVAARHFAKAVDAVPEHVGVWVIENKDVTRVRQAQKSLHLTSRSLAEMLHVADLRRLLRVPRGAVVGRMELIALCEDLPIDVVRAAVRRSLTRRLGETSAAFWQNTRNGFVTEADISRLSRFDERRRTAADLERKQKTFWAEWQLQAAELFGGSPQSVQSSSVS